MLSLRPFRSTSTSSSSSRRRSRSLSFSRSRSRSCSRSPSPSPSMAILPHTKKPLVTETDAECWERMLLLQQEYHCYNSARLEAAVEALEMGVAFEEVPIPSRLCLDLLNEGLRDWIKACSEGLVYS